MAPVANSRTRLLCLVEILTMYSDEHNILSADEICEKLKEYGYEVSKRNVLSDIKAINTTPIKIISVNQPKKGYYLAKEFYLAYLPKKVILQLQKHYHWLLALNTLSLDPADQPV